MGRNGNIYEIYSKLEEGCGLRFLSLVGLCKFDPGQWFRLAWQCPPQGHFLYDGLGSGVGGRLGMGCAEFPLPPTFPLVSVLGPERGSGGSGLASAVGGTGKIQLLGHLPILSGRCFLCSHHNEQYFTSFHNKEKPLGGSFAP